MVENLQKEGRSCCEFLSLKGQSRDLISRTIGRSGKRVCSGEECLAAFCVKMEGGGEEAGS